MDSIPRHTGASPERGSSDRLPHSQAGNDGLRRAFNRQRAEQSANASSGESVRGPQEQHTNLSCNDLVINFLRSVARRKTNSGARASDIQPVSEQDNEEVEQEKLNKILNKIVNKYKVKEDVYNQEKIRKKILEMVKGEIEKEQGNKLDKAETLVARITCYESPHEGLYTAIAEDARNLMNLEGGIIYQHGVKEYSEVKGVTNEIRQYLKNWLRSNPEVKQELQNARRQFNQENWQREQEARQRLAVENPSIVIQLRDMRNQMRDDIYHAPRQIMEQRIPEQIMEQRIPEQQQTSLQRFRQHILRRLRLDPSQPEQRLRPQWHGQQRPEQRHELQAQLQRWKRSILRRLCGSTEQIDLGTMNSEQLHQYAQGLERRVQKLKLDQPVRSGTVLDQRERRKLDRYKQEADNLHQRMSGLSRQGSLVRSDFQYLDKVAIIATKVTLSIDNRLLKNIEQQLPEGTTPGQLDRTRLGQLRQEAKELRERQRIHQTLPDEHLQPRPPRGEQDQRSPQQLMRDFRRQDNDIKDKADEIITKLKRLELPAMSSAQLNQYARELEQEVWKLPERANLREQNQRERDWLMTRVLDVQEHVQQQESDGANWRDLTSAGRKLSRSIELIVDRSRPPEQRVERMNLRAMNPVQLDLYTRMLEKQLPEGTNLGEQNRRGLERLEKKAWQLGKEIRQRQNGLVAMPPLDIYLASILRDIADRIIQSADNHLSKLEERKLGAMSSAELNQYAQILEQEAQQLSDRTNRGQREPRKLEKLQKKAQLLKNEVTQRLESEQDRIGRINLASAGRKASRSIELIMGRNR